MKDIYVNTRFYYVASAIIVVMVASYFYTPLLYIGWLMGASLLIVATVDYYILYRERPFWKVERKLDKQFYLGDLQTITYATSNEGKRTIEYELIDELPFQMQSRDSSMLFRLDQGKSDQIRSSFIPSERGEYHFGDSFLYGLNPNIGLILLRSRMPQKMMVKVLPSVLQMNNYAIKVFSKSAIDYGVRRKRVRGESDEFDHLKQYVQGDNIKSINWKATSRTGQLIINKYQDTRSQNIYCVIDKGRSMEMPFGGLSLLDHSINASLVISNIVLKKYDKAGLITFSKEVDYILKAGSNKTQLERILQGLYSQETEYSDSGFETLYAKIRSKITKRSILFLFTNFSSIHDLRRNVNYLKEINRRHLLVVITFENHELSSVADQKIDTYKDIYTKTIAQSFVYEKKQIIQELTSLGIQSIYTTPAKLSIDVINRYLEIKSRRLG